MCDIPDLLNKAIEKNLLKALGNLTTGLVNMPIRAHMNVVMLKNWQKPMLVLQLRKVLLSKLASN